MGRWILVLLIGLTLNLIVRTQQDVVEPGSGGGDDVGSGDNEDSEGSAEKPEEREADLTPCERQTASASKIPGAFSPECTRDGEFKPMQCNAKSRECWCVDREGKEKPGSRQRQSPPNKPKCTGRTEVVAHTSKPLGAVPFDSSPPVLGYSPPSDGDDIVLEDASTPKPVTATERKSSKVQSTTSAFQGYDHSDSDVDVKQPGMFTFIFQDPLILAGIVGGAVLALLCIVLLVMFTIYRMRKKDEGSYALDEPKKSYGFAYTRARDQEFFA